MWTKLDKLIHRDKKNEGRELCHAKWVHYNQNMYGDVQCSNCKFKTYVDKEVIEHIRYCPSCGARMDKK